MLFLIILGIILFLINHTVGVIYTVAILFAITIGLVIKDEKNKKKRK